MQYQSDSGWLKAKADEHERKMKIYKFWTAYSVCAKRWELEPQIQKALRRESDVPCDEFSLKTDLLFSLPGWGRGLQTESESSWSIAGCGRLDRPTTWAETPSKTSRGSWTASWIERSIYKNTSVHMYHSGLSAPDLTATAVIRHR